MMEKYRKHPPREMNAEQEGMTERVDYDDHHYYDFRNAYPNLVRVSQLRIERIYQVGNRPRDGARYVGNFDYARCCANQERLAELEGAVQIQRLPCSAHILPRSSRNNEYDQSLSLWLDSVASDNAPGNAQHSWNEKTQKG